MQRKCEPPLTLVRASTRSTPSPPRASTTSASTSTCPPRCAPFLLSSPAPTAERAELMPLPVPQIVPATHKKQVRAARPGQGQQRPEGGAYRAPREGGAEGYRRREQGGKEEGAGDFRPRFACVPPSLSLSLPRLAPLVPPAALTLSPPPRCTLAAVSAVAVPAPRRKASFPVPGQPRQSLEGQLETRIELAVLLGVCSLGEQSEVCTVLALASRARLCLWTTREERRASERTKRRAGREENALL